MMTLNVLCVTTSGYFVLHTKEVLVDLTGQEAPDKSKVHRLLRNCGFILWDLLHVTLLASEIRGSILDFWKKCGSLL